LIMVLKIDNGPSHNENKILEIDVGKIMVYSHML